LTSNQFNRNRNTEAMLWNVSQLSITQMALIKSLQQECRIHSQVLMVSRFSAIVTIDMSTNKIYKESVCIASFVRFISIPKELLL